MSHAAVLAPVFVQVALTFFVLYWSGVVRVGHTQRREVRIGDIARGQPNWPEHATQLGNNVRNQFEIPVMFYAIVGFAMITGKADLLFVVLAWGFALSRLVHAYIHTTSNRVSRRFLAYTVGSATLCLMWIVFAVRILFFS
jgi:hypothetical protein